MDGRADFFSTCSNSELKGNGIRDRWVKNSTLCIMGVGHENGINRPFDYHIRDQRGRFTPPEGSYSKYFLEFLFFVDFLRNLDFECITH